MLRSHCWLALSFVVAVTSLHAPTGEAHAAGRSRLVWSQTSSTRAAAARTHKFVRYDFPNHVRDLDDCIRLAKAEIEALEARVERYGASRSFGKYGATFSADQSAQLSLLAAKQELRRLRRERAEVWHRRDQQLRGLRADLRSAQALEQGR